MSVLTISDLRKEFGDLVAVDDVNFAVDDGEFVSILGPSGSGKSTILRMIAGFETPTAGTIEIEGENVTAAPPFDREVNMVFQSLALFPHLTVAENIGYGLVESGVPEDERRERIAEMLEVVELSGYQDRNIDQLSGGEQQRVALARAIVNEPKIVLFDEPLASLDRKLRQHMQFELQRIQEETGITFLYVTHDQEVAMAVSDRMLVLNDGEMEQLDSVETIYDKPASKFVAQFIGDINLVPASIVEANGTDVTVDSRGNRIHVSDAAGRCVDAVSLEEGADVSVGIRPTGITLGDPDREDVFSVRGEIQNRGYAGDETVYTIDTEYGSFTANTEDRSYDIGDDVTVWWPADEVYLFAPETETASVSDGGGEP
ncbi:ABC transporter ATP-binding protein [Halopenitus persicus]|uniref:Molybdate/tungstate import ATP-binding protein WtpC n=1 Tax=Halopenitus persicus TaxID=1048396 RepID=A0A1H3EU91_9EURY|nr:ABC transporter ATP-binding protein [Halopenitus persicus]QHS17684.1 ABC transporter ATP-binding protein [haloarchaeon 3A1-DGR]SDX81688.1 spermidine/putrescine transport system ATP-binding protein [Halopenitus persicus]